MKVGRLLLRAAVGGFFIGHGTQKLFGWFGGQGLKPSAEHFEGMGLKPGIVHAGAAGAAETLGGAGLAARLPHAAGVGEHRLGDADGDQSRALQERPVGAQGRLRVQRRADRCRGIAGRVGPGRPVARRAARQGEVRRAVGLFSLAAGAAGAAGAHFLAESRATPVVAAPESAPATKLRQRHRSGRRRRRSRLPPTRLRPRRQRPRRPAARPLRPEPLLRRH